MTADYRPKKNIGVALVLGGGGAKGFAHIGVIKCLEENNIPIDLIVGTSVGSIIGSVYADKADADALYESINSINKWDVLNVSVDYSLRSFYEPFGPVSGFGIENYLYHSLSAKNIEDLKIPFVAVAADLLTQKTVVINSGPIAPAVHASSALPPVISPVFGYDGIIVDGGVTMPVPVEVARSYKPKMVIAVDITTSEKQFPIYNMYDVLNRSMNTMYYSFARSQGKAADIDIHPDLNGYEFFDDSKKEELFEIGYKIALQNIPKIKAMMLKKMPKKS